MTIRVYNTLTKQKEEFVPVHPGKANIYVCGVTPYNHPHIGNARPFVTWDVIRRFLEHEGYDVLQTAQLIQHPVEFVEQCRKGME